MRRYSCSLEVGEFYTPFWNSLMYHCSEYWYMGSMLDRSKMQKKSRLALKATGRKPKIKLLIDCF